jgi:hypothetical protein
MSVILEIPQTAWVASNAHVRSTALISFVRGKVEASGGLGVAVRLPNEGSVDLATRHPRGWLS